MMLEFWLKIDHKSKITSVGTRTAPATEIPARSGPVVERAQPIEFGIGGDEAHRGSVREVDHP
jgi:hypothetical protein